MITLTHEAFPNHSFTFTQFEWDMFHDVVLYATGKSCEGLLLERMFYNLSGEIVSDIRLWGITDTCVRDDITNFLESTE